MVQIIVGVKGKGETKRLLEMANEAVKNAKGTIVYLDKSVKHMYEFSNRIHSINVNDYEIISNGGFTGSISGIISQDHDLKTVFLGSFLKLTNLEGGDITPVVDTLERIGEKYNANFMLSVSMDAADLSENAEKDVVIAPWPISAKRIYGQPFPDCPSLCTGIFSVSGGRFGESKKDGQ